MRVTNLDPMVFASLLLNFLLFIDQVNASVTVQYQLQKQQQMSASIAATASVATYTGEAAYNPKVLIAPPAPDPATTNVQINLAPTVQQAGLSIPLKNPFFGFSIEMSVSAQVYGKNSSFINVPFLNLMANVVERAGEVHIRCGGNTQESAAMVDSNPNGGMISKDYSSVTGTTNTPPIDYTVELIYLLSNISSLVNVKWFLGIPFNDTNFRMQIAQEGSRILGDNLIGMQAGNEPDFYTRFGRRPEGYDVNAYKGEVGQVIEILQDPQYEKVRNKIITPSVASEWNLQDVWDSGLIQENANSIAYISVERYPANNCAAVFGTNGNVINPQDVIGDYLAHSKVRDLVSFYASSTLFAQTQSKPFIMFETNTASCGGFPGISNAFSASLWALDYGLQMAYTNFSEALLHVGGQSVVYNPFTAPPTNVSSFHQWTVGPIYYSVLVMAETIGSSGSARVADLFANDNNDQTPAYVIHEGDSPARVALFNYAEDTTGGHDYTATISVPGTIDSVKVKRLTSKTVTQLNGIYWANQTFGVNFASDGRPMGDLVVDIVTCTPSTATAPDGSTITSSTCLVTVPAPGFALVFLTQSALDESDNAHPTETFATTAYTKAHNTLTVDPSVLATSNGQDATVRKYLGSTSFGTADRKSVV